MIESQNANNIKNSENLNQAKGKFLWRFALAFKIEIVLLQIQESNAHIKKNENVTYIPHQTDPSN